MDALYLFFNQKFFSSVKIAVVSFNNLMLHFEEEHQDFYMDEITEMLMPLLNNFKNKVIDNMMAG